LAESLPNLVELSAQSFLQSHDVRLIFAQDVHDQVTPVFPAVFVIFVCVALQNIESHDPQLQGVFRSRADTGCRDILARA
jgi:hypothetical protein